MLKRILITNDDGIHAPGLTVLEEIALQFAKEVWVVAPEKDQSGLAHSLTMNEPLRLRKVEGTKFALSGTPTDCVIMGVNELMDKRPDLILSGINSGQNIADDVTYSGTVAGAMEGTLLGIPSIAVSQAYDWTDGLRSIRWETSQHHVPDMIRKIMEFKFPTKTLVNLNLPNCKPEEIKGVEITRQGNHNHGLSMEKRHDGRGFPYYWLRFGREQVAQLGGTDIEALAQNKISITPLTLDWTHTAFREELQSKFSNES